MLSEFTGLLGAAIGSERGYAGPMGKSDRALVFGIAGLLIGWGMPFGGYLNGLWALVAVLLVITIFNRCRAAVRQQGQP
jgi:CDP-diacylglycerol--glycerol-3-phosphate 3-phosphatidyltransferase